MQPTQQEQPLTCVYSVRSYLGGVDGEVFTSWLGLWTLNLPQKGSVPLTISPVVMTPFISDRLKKKKTRGVERLENDSEDTSTVKRFMKIQEVGIQNLSNSPTLKYSPAQINGEHLQGNCSPA